MFNCHLNAIARDLGKFQSDNLLPHPLGIFPGRDFVPEAIFGELREQTASGTL